MGKTFTFGSDDSSVAMITDPIKTPIPVGAILWGMGVGELRVARMLARLGITAMQVRRVKFSQAALDASGVRCGLEAMDVLRRERGIERFIVMGNCAFASISFNLALRCPDVVGLILSNPHASSVLSLSSTYKYRVSRLESWRRVFSGKANLRAHLINTGLLKEFVLGRLKGSDDKALIAKDRFNKDLVLPDNVAGRLEQLGASGVHTLLVFSQADSSLLYFRRLFGKDLNTLRGLPRLSIELLSTREHLVSSDDRAAEQLVSAVSAWAERMDWSALRAPSQPSTLSPQTAPVSQPAG